MARFLSKLRRYFYFILFYLCFMRSPLLAVAAVFVVVVVVRVPGAACASLFFVCFLNIKIDAATIAIRLDLTPNTSLGGIRKEILVRET